jgi:hypothetical protein
VVYDEAFQGSPGKWPTNNQLTAWLPDNAYHVFAAPPNRFVTVTAPVTQPLRDVIVEARLRKAGGPSGGGYGIVVRDQGPAASPEGERSGRFYVAEVSDRGEVGVWRRDGDRWIDLLTWTPSGAVHTDGTANQLSVQVTGQRLVFLVNGTQVAALRDLVLPDGSAGILVGGDLNEVILERFTVRSVVSGEDQDIRPGVRPAGTQAPTYE